MRAKHAAQSLLIAQLGHHPIELADEGAKLIGPVRWDLHSEIALRDRAGGFAELLDRLGNGAADQERRAQSEGNADHADEKAEPLGVRARRGRREIEEKEGSDRADAGGDGPHQASGAEGDRVNAAQPIRAHVPEERGKERPVAGEFDREKALRHRHETGDGEGDRQIPEEQRIERLSDGREGEQEHWDAEKPGRARDHCTEPREMDQPASQTIELLGGHGFAPEQPLKGLAEGINPAHPDRERHRVGDGVPNDDGANEAAVQTRRAEERVDHDHVVPDVEDAAEDLRNQRRQGGDEQRQADVSRGAGVA